MSFDLITEEYEKQSNSNSIFVIDRFEDNFAVCEKQDSEELVNIERNLIPKNAIEGMTLKKVGEKYIVDYENCIVTKKIIIDKLKNNWEKEENTEYYFVSSVLENAVKCTNIFIKQNIIIKDEPIIALLKKGDIVKYINNEYIFDESKNLEIENEIKKILEYNIYK